MIAIVVHVLMAVVGAFWAAHEGMFGAKLQNLAVFMVPKDKKADEPEKKKEPEAKKTEEPEKIVKTAAAAPPPFVPPAGSGPAAAAPPPAYSLDLGTLGDDTVTGNGGDLVANYKQQVETLLRTRWERPGGVQDLDYVAEVEMNVDSKGKINDYTWKKGSGNQAWDGSVKQALANCKAMSRPPPKGFPEKFTVRFDVQPSTEPVFSRAD